MILVRHSERADDPSMPYEIKMKQDDIIIEYDPQLSRPTGKTQAVLTAQYIKQKLTQIEYGIDLENAEIFLFSSPFLTCLESSTAIAKEIKIKSISVQDQLSDILMKNWYPEDPFLGLTTKLTNNKEKFTQFLKNQYDVPELTIEYKRSTNLVTYPETVDSTSKRY
ncbi:UNKNOWN [Stylonychia lemnae]|uniref:Phosphoglycerate mutase family protein n=1 Tax=Stylonychia lemnae TaxID=5949 RepID=A0A078B499_STYLE|nr:UNKNOWN [Stylonychia lemnae]|eukprot:CDW89076.1 UNKNOWN [Stylonychia lemnae]